MLAIFVDGDACPVKAEVERVATRHALAVNIVSNGGLRPSANPLLRHVTVAEGADAADDWIVEHIAAGDIAITADILLAARCLDKGARVLAPNGKPFSENSIGMTLAVRNLMTDLRSSGEVTGGPKSFASRDRSTFLSTLDQTIRRIQRQRAEQPAPNQN